MASSEPTTIGESSENDSDESESMMVMTPPPKPKRKSPLKFRPLVYKPQLPSENGHLNQRKRIAEDTWISTGKKSKVGSAAGHHVYSPRPFNAVPVGVNPFQNKVQNASLTSDPAYSAFPKQNKSNMHQQELQKNYDDLDDDLDGENLSGILSQFGSMIQKRLKAKKHRIENTFKMIQAPTTFFEMQKAQSEARIEKYRKYDSTVDKFRLQLDGILRRHEKNTGTFLKMMESIQKGTKVITTEIAAIQNGVAALTSNMTKSLEDFEENIRKSEKAMVEKFEEELEKWEHYCLEVEDNQTVRTLETLVKYI